MVYGLLFLVNDRFFGFEKSVTILGALNLVLVRMISHIKGKIKPSY